MAATHRRIGPATPLRATFRAALAASVLAALLAAGCATPPRPLTGAAPASGVSRESAFSTELADPPQRDAAFERAWRLVHERFYDPSFNGVDWEAVRLKYLPQVERVHSDNQFYALVGRMLGELRDSHTRAYNAGEYRNRMAYVASTYGVRVTAIDGEVTVTQVLPGTSAAQAGLKPGMIVEKINDEIAGERLRRLQADMPADASPERRLRSLYGRLVAGRADAPLALDVRAPDGSRRFDLARTEQEVPLKVTQRTLPGNLGYIAFNRFRPEAAAEVGQALVALRETDGLVLDLRGNPGGSIGAMLSIAQAFFPESRHVLTRRARETATADDEPDASGRPRTSSPEVRISANRQAYTRPLAILIDGYTASSSELLATVLREQLGAHVVGRASCGCVVAVRGAGYRLPGGGALYVAETGFVTPRGNRMEGAGMRPDRAVDLTLADLREGIDRDLLEATQWLGSRAPRMAEEH